MLHILFLILKIIGIVLLAVLGTAILLVGVVLFVPARYRVQAETEDSISNLVLHARATWLLHLITAYVDYNGNKTDWQVRIAWKKLHVEKSAKKSKRKRQELESEEVDEPVCADIESEDTECTVASDKGHAETKPNKKRNIFEKIRYTIQKICDKIKEIWETKEKIIAYISNEVHQTAFGKVMTQFWELMKHLKPKKLDGKVRFGLKEPYNTGRVLAFLSMLYPFYGENIRIYPEFEEEVLEGHVKMSGRIRISKLLVILCKLYFDKDIKTAYENIRRK